MSLIQDALKRKSEETAVITPPVPAMDEPAERSPSGKTPPPVLTVLIILLTAGLIAALVGLSLYLLRPQPAAQPAPKATFSEPPAPAPPPVSEPVEAVRPKPENTPVEPPEKKSPPPEIKADWPELTLTGIGQAEGQNLAILNGKMITAGRSLGEVSVVEVGDENIVLEYRGERRVLYINE
jgi:hypothetical protein